MQFPLGQDSLRRLRMIQAQIDPHRLTLQQSLALNDECLRQVPRNIRVGAVLIPISAISSMFSSISGLRWLKTCNPAVKLGVGAFETAATQHLMYDLRRNLGIRVTVKQETQLLLVLSLCTRLFVELRLSKSIYHRLLVLFHLAQLVLEVNGLWLQLLYNRGLRTEHPSHRELHEQRHALHIPALMGWCLVATVVVLIWAHEAPKVLAEHSGFSEKSFAVLSLLLSMAAWGRLGLYSALRGVPSVPLNACVTLLITQVVRLILALPRCARSSFARLGVAAYALNIVCLFYNAFLMKQRSMDRVSHVPY